MSQFPKACEQGSYWVDHNIEKGALGLQYPFTLRKDHIGKFGPQI